MPLLRVSTAQSVSRDRQRKLLLNASNMVARELGKPESYVMTQFEQLETMTFGGSDEDACFLQLKSIGLPESKTSSLSESLCAFIEAELAIPKERVYIEFVDAPRAMWGFNGSTFG